MIVADPFERLRLVMVPLCGFQGRMAQQRGNNPHVARILNSDHGRRTIAEQVWVDGGSERFLSEPANRLSKPNVVSAPPSCDVQSASPPLPVSRHLP